MLDWIKNFNSVISPTVELNQLNLMRLRQMIKDFLFFYTNLSKKELKYTSKLKKRQCTLKQQTAYQACKEFRPNEPFYTKLNQP